MELKVFCKLAQTAVESLEGKKLFFLHGQSDQRKLLRVQWKI